MSINFNNPAVFTLSLWKSNLVRQGIGSFVANDTSVKLMNHGCECSWFIAGLVGFFFFLSAIFGG